MTTLDGLLITLLIGAMAWVVVGVIANEQHKRIERHQRERIDYLTGMYDLYWRRYHDLLAHQPVVNDEAIDVMAYMHDKSALDSDWAAIVADGCAAWQQTLREVAAKKAEWV